MPHAVYAGPCVAATPVGMAQCGAAAPVLPPSLSDAGLTAAVPKLYDAMIWQGSSMLCGVQAELQPQQEPQPIPLHQPMIINRYRLKILVQAAHKEHFEQFGLLRPTWAKHWASRITSSPLI